jgi:methylmalonyl-CoA mutase cobalamin-binding subunit
MGMEVVEVAGQVDTWQSATTTAMHDDGRVVVISGGIDRMDTGNHVFPARVAGLRVTDMEEACTC